MRSRTRSIRQTSASQPAHARGAFSKGELMSVVEHHDVVESGDARTDTRVATTRLVVSPGQVIAAVLGLVIATIAIMTVSRAGLDSTLNVPIVRVAGLDQSAMLGA